MPTITGYATAASGANWTSPTAAAGTPDDVGASCQFTGQYLSVTFGGFAALPADAVINKVVLGVRLRHDDLALRTSVAMTVGDTSQPVLSTAAANVWENQEVVLSTGLFTPAMIKGSLGASVWMSAGAGSFRTNIDAVWVKVTYNEPTRLIEISSYATALSYTTGATATANVLGPPDGLVATRTTTTTTLDGLRATFNLSELDSYPDAVLTQVRWGFRGASNTTNGDVQIISRLANNTTTETFTLDPATTLTDYEFTATYAWTIAALKTAQLAWYSRSASSVSKTSTADALWVTATVRVLDTAQPSRAKRWDGDSWEDAAIKRWDGSAWVPAVVKRFDGSAWV